MLRVDFRVQIPRLPACFAQVNSGQANIKNHGSHLPACYAQMNSEGLKQIPRLKT